MAISNLPGGVRFRQDLAVREAARKASAAVDNDQTMRSAIVQRSRPHQGFFEKGEWVMMWKKKVESDGDWVGPMQVIIQASQIVVWATRQHKLYRVAPENVRTLSAMEEFRNTPDMNNTHPQSPSTVVPTRGGVQFHGQVPNYQITPIHQLALYLKIPNQKKDMRADVPMYLQKLEQSPVPQRHHFPQMSDHQHTISQMASLRFNPFLPTIHTDELMKSALKTN